VDAKGATCALSAIKMEMKMQLKTIIMLAVAVFVAIAAQAAAASEHHHARAKGRAVASEQFRNSNAYAPPAVQSYGPDYSEGAMTSGIAGH
jgi:hypothetical protein